MFCYTATEIKKRVGSYRRNQHGSISVAVPKFTQISKPLKHSGSINRFHIHIAFIVIDRNVVNKFANKKCSFSVIYIANPNPISLEWRDYCQCSDILFNQIFVFCGVILDVSIEQAENVISLFH